MRIGTQLNRTSVALCAAILVSFAASNASAAIFLDDFNTDTSANYSYEDSFGSGGSFAIDAADSNVLAVTTGSNNTATVVHETAQLDVGETVHVITPNANDTFLMITTATDFGQPNGSADHGIRFRRDNTSGKLRYTTYTNGGNSTVTTTEDDPDTNAALEIWIDRVTATDFELYFGDALSRTLVGSTSLQASEVDTELLRIGVQAFNAGGGPTFNFDDLQISAIPVPAPAAMPAGLAMLGLAAARRRRRS